MHAGPRAASAWPSELLAHRRMELPGRRRLARAVSSSDFEGALRLRSRATTLHFAMHHLKPLRGPDAAPKPAQTSPQLSTTEVITGALPVDSSPVGSVPTPQWLGAVVPKRLARRAVTRALLKRQIYAVGERHRDRLAEGVWIVRQRAGFDRALFPSASSEALKRTARTELEALFQAVAA